jgi:hypothetical protein
MTPAQLLSDTRLLLRGTPNPIPDPKRRTRALRIANAAMDRAERGERVWVFGYLLRVEAGAFLLGPSEPMSAGPCLVQLVELGEL